MRPEVGLDDLVKAALTGSGVSLAGGLVAYVAATLAFGVVLLLPEALTTWHWP